MAREHESDAPPKPAAERRPPEEWRALLAPRASHHAAARMLHGWTEHEHHQGAPMQLSESAYREAIAFAVRVPAIPSPNAVSPHRGRGV